MKIEIVFHKILERIGVLDRLTERINEGVRVRLQGQLHLQLLPVDKEKRGPAGPFSGPRGLC
jgi:hypothetical protein